MPEITTKPIFQAAPPATRGAQAFNGTVAPSNIPDTPGGANLGNVPTTASTAKSTASDTDSRTTEDGGEGSFANVLQRQLAQAGASDKTVPDGVPLPDFASQPRADTTLAAAPSAQPVSVEALLSDLSDLAARLSQRGSNPVSATAKDTTVDSQAPSVATFTSDAIAVQLATVADPVTEPTLQASGPAAQKEDDADHELPADGAVSMLPYLSTIPSNTTAKPETGAEGNEKKPAATTSGSILASAMPISNANKEAPSAATAGLPRETASKSAEFAATLVSSTETVPTHAEHGESADTEKSFENLLGSAQAANQNRNNVTHAAGNPTPSLPVQTPVGKHGWDGEVGDKLVWMVGRQEQRAELVLNPPQMGRIEVSLSMSDGQTSALFVSANPAVRDALETALPHLRELLADAGVSLGQTQVGAGTGNNAGNPSTNNPENGDNSGRGLSRDAMPSSGEMLRQAEAPQWLKRGNGLVDVFA